MKTAIIEWYDAIAHWAEGPQTIGTALTEALAWEKIEQNKHLLGGDPIHGFTVKRRTQTGILIAAVEHN